MSKSAESINAALKLYRECQNTPAEQAAFEHLSAVVERVKNDNCCGGRCRWCTEWRK